MGQVWYGLFCCCEFGEEVSFQTLKSRPVTNLFCNGFCHGSMLPFTYLKVPNNHVGNDMNKTLCFRYIFETSLLIYSLSFDQVHIFGGDSNSWTQQNEYAYQVLSDEHYSYLIELLRHVFRHQCAIIMLQYFPEHLDLKE